MGKRSGENGSVYFAVSAKSCLNSSEGKRVPVVSAFNTLKNKELLVHIKLWV
jgi:hypothetical protein